MPLQPITMMRESLYAAGYLGVAPLLREALEQQPGVRSMPGGPLILSGISAGLLATVTTQPADTIKTRMQVGHLVAATRVCTGAASSFAAFHFLPLHLAPHPFLLSGQAFPDAAIHPEYRSTLSTVRHIVTSEGIGTLWAGLLPRSIRIVCAVFILNGTRNTLVDMMERRQAAAG